MNVQELISGIKDKDADVRAKTWLNAGPVGASAIKPLSKVMDGSDFEVSRAAKRAMWKVVRHAARPGVDEERKEVVAALLAVCADDSSVAVRREVLWMLSETAGEEAVDTAAGFLGDSDLREHARMTLERIPGDKSLSALLKALPTAPDDFKPNITQSLRQRGHNVPGIRCRKLHPTKQTNVKPVGR